ncbi:NGP1NT-domain-containing protein [Tilletiaria anomala UBC 951]|uniref:Nucleolar GTP-binding protein 2 n=1 Tax=Tilletiaria anomala (strain ATCC 24038 / CBS 436.72 / UBC 951) TaxID=1037660 RepID=A0A066VER5_TILAU|nr:NGP1NT-domain-containing protein [Tilletiaria anomala UBC 951]KDN37249.1 NGP1NT-domain-containing protein [Tilletiaria anomala UBC 951]
MPASIGKSKSSAPGIKKVKGENFYRDAKGAKRVKLLAKNGIASKAIRDKDGNIIQAAEFQSSEAKPGRVQPDRRWFGNTRVISQDALAHFRESMSSRVDDPYSVLLRRNKLPMSLIQEPSSKSSPAGIGSNKLTAVESFSDTFGPSARRKRPRLDPTAIGSFEEFAQSGTTAIDDAETAAEAAQAKARGVGLVPEDAEIGAVQAEVPYEIPVQRGRSEPIYSKGQSRRIWGELYKVIDSSDVVIHVLDVRDPEGTRCRSVEKHIKEEKPHKHLVFVLNKVDLVPTWVTARWVKILSQTAPTLAFHASVNNSFGKGSLISLLRQYSVLHSDKKQISVGFVGYPNTGKSSIINTLKKKKVCKTAPIPGETKVWQYIALMRRIYLIDCPGIVPISAHDSETGTVLKGVVRVENLETPAEHIPALLGRIKAEHLQKTYGLNKWMDADDFLSQLAKKMGKLLRGGEPDMETAAKCVLNDWIRGKLPFFVAPPTAESNATGKEKWAGAVKGVTQPLRGINPVHREAKGATEGDQRSALGVDKDEATEVVSTEEFDDEDIQAEEDEDDKDIQEEEDEDDDDDGSDASADSLEQLGWDDVFGGAEAEEDESFTDEEGEESEHGDHSKAEDKARAEQLSEDDEQARGKNAKAPRMATSKRKAENFYTHANVKNKNRNKAKLSASIAAQNRNSRGSRIGANGKAARTAKKSKHRS